MGDIADWMIEKMQNPFSFDDHHEEDEVRCKYCGSTDVYWMQVQGHGVKYKLIDENTGQQHRCNHMDDNEFEDLS